MKLHRHDRGNVRLWYARIDRWIALIFVIVSCGTQAHGATPAKFFKAAPAAGTNLSPTGIYPHGQQFGFGLYSINGNSKVDPSLSNLRRVAESGFTLAGPYYDFNSSDLPRIRAAAKEGLKFTYQIRPPTSLAGLSHDHRATALDKFTNAQMAAGIREQVIAILNDPVASNSVARWSLGLEAARFWKPSEMRYLKIARDTVRAIEKERGVAPRPFFMYEPGNRNATDLMKTGIYQDIVNKGVYLSSLPRGTERSGYAIWSYTQIANAALKLKTVPHATLSLFEDFKDPLTKNSPSEIRRVLRHDAYLGLVMGMKGFNIWSMVENRPNLTTHNEQFLSYASVVEDLTGPLNLDDVFLFGQRRNDLLFTITQGTKTLPYKDVYGKKFNFSALHSLNAAVGNDRYLFLVNSSEQPMAVKIQGLPTSFLLDDLFAGSTAAHSQTSLTWRLEPLGVAALRLRKYSSTALAAAAKLSVAAVPEPSACALALMALLYGLSNASRRRLATEVNRPSKHSS